MYVSYIAAYIIAVFSNTTWRRVIIPYGAVPYRYRTAAVLPVLYRTVRYGTVQVPYRPVRYDTVRYGTGTGTAVFNIEFIQWPDPFSKYMFSQKNLYYEEGCRGGTDFLTPWRYLFSTKTN